MANYPNSPVITKIKLPGSSEPYWVSDSDARTAIDNLEQQIAGGVAFIIAWDGTSVPVPASIPSGINVIYQGTTYTGTMSAENAQAGAFYLIRSSTSAGVTDVYDEYVPVGEAGSKTWEKIGDTQIDLTDVVTDVSLSKGTTNVLGASATFQVPATTVGITGGTTDVVLGEATTFALTSGAVTFDTPSTETFVKSVSAETGKSLVTTSITPTNGTEIVSKVTQTDSKLVTTSITPTNGTESVSKVTKTDSKLVTTTVPSVSSVGTSSTWSFTMGSGTEAETLIIDGANSTTPTLGTAVTVATGAVASDAAGAAVVTSVSISDKTVAKAGSAVTVATGAVATNASGAAVVTSVSISDKSVAKVGSAITVATGETSTTGSGAAVVTGVTIGSSGSAIVAMPNGAVGTGITVGINDKVTAVKTIGTATLPSTSVSVTSKDQKTVLTSATDVSVTKGNA